MKQQMIFASFLVFQMSFLSLASADNSGNPYANMPQGVMPNGMDFRKMMQNQEAAKERKKKKRVERDAITKAVYDEEVTKAKAELKPGSLVNPYVVAESRMKKRMAPYYKKWKEEDEAVNAPLKQKGIKNAQQLKQTGDFKQYGLQQREMLKQMGIELPSDK